MKFLAALLLLATLVSCAGPTAEPAGEVAVLQPGVVCRVGRDGGPAVADRGIGGTGSPVRTQIVDRGIGGTGIVGIVTGFASICVDGLEVRFDKTAAVSINGAAATTAQLRVGQLVAIKAGSTADAALQARTIAVRYEVSGPIEAIDTGSGAMTVAGQRVTVLPATWMAGRFGLGNWVTVSGLRQPDGTILASRLDRARVGALAVRGQLSREHETARVGSLVLQGPAIAFAKTGTFVSVTGRYVDMSAEVINIEADPMLDDPAGRLGLGANQLIVQAFVRVDSSTVWLANGEKFKAGPEVHGQGSGYRDAVVWLKRSADGSFAATELHYTSYRAKPDPAPAKVAGKGIGDLVLPPEAPPGPPMDNPPADATGDEPVVDGNTPAAPPTGTPALDPTTKPSADGALTTDRDPALPSSLIVALEHRRGHNLP